MIFNVCSLYEHLFDPSVQAVNWTDNIRNQKPLN
ncbi:hypothetical protein AI2828V5_4602 [Klebsiella oxytoca]|nr:hypothetical protein AI2828V5_4602 [Klebsiella oxytoca]CAH5834529.1 hypothetical protein AI2828V5_4602 [Klebsiella oxytoca]